MLDWLINFRADYYFAGLLPGATAPATRPMCQLAPPVCDPSARYRTIDGSCNNLRNPTWGMTGSLFNRLIPAKYADGMQKSQKSVNLCKSRKQKFRYCSSCGRRLAARPRAQRHFVPRREPGRPHLDADRHAMVSGHHPRHVHGRRLQTA